MDPKDLLTPRRRLLFADGTERPFPDDLIGDFERIKEILGFDMGQIVFLPNYGPRPVRDWVLVIDENAKVMGGPMIVNLEATRLHLDLNVSVDQLRIMIATTHVDVIVGNAALCRYEDFRDEPEPDQDNE